MMTETAVTKQVLKKLSALRATLTDEEQAVLDSMIISGEDDVEAHRMRIARASSTGEDEANAHRMRIVHASSLGEDDANAHAMRVTERVYRDEDDANAHAMRVSERSRLEEDDAMAHALPEGAKLQPRIVFNPETEVYYIE